MDDLTLRLMRKALTTPYPDPAISQEQDTSARILLIELLADIPDMQTRRASEAVSQAPDVSRAVREAAEAV